MFYFISPVESVDLDFFSWLRKIEIIPHYGKSNLSNVGGGGLLKNPTPVAEMSRTGLRNRNKLNKCERLRYDSDAIR